MVVDYIQFVGSREGVGVKRVQTTVPKENPRSPHHAHSKLTEIRPLGPPPPPLGLPQLERHLHPKKSDMQEAACHISTYYNDFVLTCTFIKMLVTDTCKNGDGAVQHIFKFC